MLYLQYSEADAALDQGSAQAQAYGKDHEIAFDDLSSDLDDTDFYGSGGGLRHGDTRAGLLGAGGDGDMRDGTDRGNGFWGSRGEGEGR